MATSGGTPARHGKAVNRLEMAGLPFVYYLDGEHGRANVIYHRHDGHYGLIDPPTHGG